MRILLAPFIFIVVGLTGCGGQSLDDQIANGPIQWRVEQRVHDCKSEGDERAACLVTNQVTGQTVAVYFHKDVGGWVLAPESIDTLP